MSLDRDRALALMHEYTASDALRKHMYAVEIAMRAMAAGAGEDQGAWGLRAGSRVLRYDEAHRLLAEVLGWDALPSPASRLRPVAEGYEVEGVGSGHRVGLCLAN